MAMGNAALIAAALLLPPAPAGGRSAPAPIVPPATHYVLEVSLDSAGRQITGNGMVTVRNVGRSPLTAVAFEWKDPRAEPFQLTMAGSTREYAPASDAIEVPLAAPLAPGATLRLRLRFRRPVGDLDEGWATDEWFPRLWWGYATHASYDVGVNVPPGVVVGASARLDARTGRYRADHIRSFGLFLGRGFMVAELAAGATVARSIFRADMQECARVVLESAADAIGFYRRRFGMYPQPSLTIIPGAPKPWGGYPFATAMVVVHGQQACAEAPREHWRWIAAHEVGHQYWIEHVLEKEPEQGDGWLMIGLGIWSDREFGRTRGFSAAYRRFRDGYADAVRKGLNTTIEIAPEVVASLDFDYNSHVTHAKGFAIVSALAAVLGPETFERVYRRALTEYAGRRLGTAEFRALAEAESGQDLGWFFVPLLRSGRFASYVVESTDTGSIDGRPVVRVTIRSEGGVLLPVPVEAQFANGARMRLVLDRTRDLQTLEFASPAALSAVVIDPDQDFPLVVPPPEITAARLAELVHELPWVGAGDRPLRLFRRAVELDARDGGVWTRLGLTLFDGGHYAEALQAFDRALPLVAGKNPSWQFGALVWRGMLDDLLGRREAALQAYRDALALPGDVTLRHSQYDLVLDRAWVQKRIEAPFTWGSGKR